MRSRINLSKASPLTAPSISNGALPTRSDTTARVTPSKPALLRPESKQRTNACYRPLRVAIPVHSLVTSPSSSRLNPAALTLTGCTIRAEATCHSTLDNQHQRFYGLRCCLRSLISLVLSQLRNRSGHPVFTPPQSCVAPVNGMQLSGSPYRASERPPAYPTRLVFLTSLRAGLSPALDAVAWF